MNPRNLSASDMVIWGIVLHLIADWPLQNDWMANNKAKRIQRYNPTTRTGERGTPYTSWWLRHPAAFIHAFIHIFCLSFVFGWAAFIIGFVHLLIDTRTPVVWWSKLIRQTQPANRSIYQRWSVTSPVEEIPAYDIGLEVRFWTDQVFHITCVAIAALLIHL
jgi:hypothetical protein